MPASFNLVDQPFIPCPGAGGPRQLGLAEAFRRAHEIAEVRDESPLVTAALHRLLLAIAHRVWGGPLDHDDWRSRWAAGRFDRDAFGGYFREWHGRFDLFDEKYPFYQDARYDGRDKPGVSRLVRHLARGNNPTLFDHTTDATDLALPPAEAARALIAEQTFAISEGKSELGHTKGGPLAGGVVVLVRGRNLFETVLLNMPTYDEHGPVRQKREDRPCWERDRRPTDSPPSPAGYLDYLTWLNRSIRLEPEEGRVRRISYAAGRPFEPGGMIYDPMMPYRTDAKDEDRPVRLSEERDLWRDSSALFQWADRQRVAGRKERAPETIRQLHDRLPVRGLERHELSLDVFGLCTDKAKVNFWRHETLPLRPEYLRDAAVVDALRAALDMAEEVGRALRGAAATVAREALTAGTRTPDSKKQWAMVDALAPDRLYWSRLEGPFRGLLLDLPGDAGHLRRRIGRWFSDVLRRTAVAAFGETAGDLAGSARALRSSVVGGRQLARALGRIAATNHLPAPESHGVST